VTDSAVEVTVVIPTRNRARLLGRALAGVLGQQEVRLDETASALGRVDDPRLRVIRLSPRQGVARARNTAIAEAHGTWVAFLDDDDVWAPHKLRRQIESARKNEAALVYSPAVVVDEDGRVKLVTEPAAPAALGRAMLETNTIGTPSGVVALTRAILDLDGFDDRLSTFADWDLWLRLLQRGPAAMVEEPLFAYTEHRTNMHVTQIGAARAELSYLARKHKALCRTQGVRFGSISLSRWLLSHYRPQGRRVDAAREYAAVGIRHRSARDLGRAVGVLLGERYLRLGRALVGPDRDSDKPQGRRAAPLWLAEALTGNAFPLPAGG
jgi:glycosyltransferase involved in cell wall biosynthesis